MSRAVAFLVALVVAFLGVAVIFAHPTWLAGGYDWRYFETSMETARRTIAWFHQVPLYNPWMCGGEAQLANPQSIAGSPAMLLVVLFGTALGEKLMLLAFVIAGIDGTYRLCRALGIDRDGALAGAITFGLSGWVVQHFGIGHVSFFGATLVPHALFFYLRAKADLRFAIALGLVLAIVLAQGGTSTAAMATIALGLVGLVDATAERSTRPLVVLILGALAAALLGAYRLWPALEFAIDHPRHVVESDTQSPLELVRAAFWWSGSGRPPGHRYGFHEYAWRLPFLAWPLLALGLSVRGRLRRWAIALTLIGAGIAMGDFIAYGPWWIMRHLPVLRDLRVPSRYVLLCALGLSLACAAGAQRFRDRVGNIGLVLVVLLAIDAVIYGNTQLAHAFDLRPPPVSHAAFFQVRGHYARMLELVWDNRGVIGCDEEAPLTRAIALDEGDVPQARLEAGRVENIAWSPDAIELDVHAPSPTKLLVDLNWNEHWTSSVGRVVRGGPKWPADHDGGRLAVELPAMDGHVVLRYRPTSFVLGAWTSVLSLLVAFATLRRAVA